MKRNLGVWYIFFVLIALAVANAVQAQSVAAGAAPESISLAALGLFTGSSLLGMVFHWAKKRARGEIPDTFYDYFLVHNVGRTMSTVGTLVTASIAAAFAGSATGLDTHALFEALRHGALHVPSCITLWASFLTGLACDSTINKGSPQ